MTVWLGCEQLAGIFGNYWLFIVFQRYKSGKENGPPEGPFAFFTARSLICRPTGDTDRAAPGWIVHGFERFIPPTGQQATRRGLPLSQTRPAVCFGSGNSSKIRRPDSLFGGYVVREAEACGFQRCWSPIRLAATFRASIQAAADAVRELLLRRRDAGRQDSKAFAQNAFFHFAVAAHLILRVNAHRDVVRNFVEERHAGLHAPCGHRFVGARAQSTYAAPVATHRLRAVLWRSAPYGSRV